MGLADLAKKNRYQSCKDLVSVLFVFSHYLIMGGFFCIPKKPLFPHFKPLVNVPKMYRLQVIYINQLREAVSDDQDTIFLILFFSHRPA